MDTAKFLMASFPTLKKYSLKVVRVAIRRKNPVPLLTLLSTGNDARSAFKKNPAKPIERTAELRQAARRLQEFTGSEPTEIIEVPDYRSKAGLVVGKLDGVPYETVRAGRVERYLHKFKKNARPLLATSPDGREVRIVGGRFQFTEAGFVDDD
jgi:hypothetical protein